MKPEEKKARELVDKYLMVMPRKNVPNDHAIYGRAKQAAIICVDEILKLPVVWYDEKIAPEDEATTEFWESVKKEITNL